MSRGGPALVVYGGAFDPPHAGHVACAELVRKAFPEARLKVVPGLKPATSGGIAKEPSASFEDRVAMCRLAFREAEVDTIESGLPTPNFSYRTLATLVAREPNVGIAWLLGSDQLKAFASWRDPQKILDLAELLIVSRPGVEGPLALPDGLHGRLRLIGTANTPASSQMIRQYLAKGKPVPTAWLPEAVADYIAQHALYSQRNTHESP